MSINPLENIAKGELFNWRRGGRSTMLKVGVCQKGYSLAMELFIVKNRIVTLFGSCHKDRMVGLFWELDTKVARVKNSSQPPSLFHLISLQALTFHVIEPFSL